MLYNYSYIMVAGRKSVHAVGLKYIQYASAYTIIFITDRHYQNIIKTIYSVRKQLNY